ncbi:MAG: hypothetical protein NT178_18520, partial [Proteobacteria bacterium]|nr:hypothetical protein [Pseudomonadota bacterium]
EKIKYEPIQPDTETLKRYIYIDKYFLFKEAIWRVYREHVEELFKDLNNPEFTDSEFSIMNTSEDLCRKIIADFALTIEGNGTAVDKLNQILRIPNFYDIWKEKHKNQFAMDIMNKDLFNQLAQETHGYRNKHFDLLNDSEKEKIMKINRIAIQTEYLLCYPKQFIEFNEENIIQSVLEKISTFNIGKHWSSIVKDAISDSAESMIKTIESSMNKKRILDKIRIP